MGDESRSDYRTYRDNRFRPPLVDIPRARTTDRETSHLAAAAIKPSLGDQQREALDMVRRYPGRTTAELAKLRADETGRHWEAVRHIFGRRLSELNQVHIDGRDPRRCAVTGRQATTWHARQEPTV